MSNTSRVRLFGGKLDVIVAACSSKESYSIVRATPSLRTERGAEGNVHALTRIPPLEAQGVFESKIEVEYVTSNRSFQFGQNAVTIGPTVLNDEFCRAAKFWEITDPAIKLASERLRLSSRDVEGFVSQVFAWVRNNVKLRDRQQDRLGAAHAIRELAGDCDEMSDLFIALCRASNVPCRRVVGLFYHGRQSEPTPFEWHAWAEIRASADAWIPFDPSLNFFASISDRHLARCCMGIRPDYPLRRLTWRSQPDKSPTMNDDDVETVTVMPI